MTMDNPELLGAKRIKVLDNEVRSDEELTTEFVTKYRLAMGMPPVKDFSKTGLKGCLGEGVKTYRYLTPGKQFAMTDDEKIKDALLEAGAHRVIPFTRCLNGTKVYYDVALPSYLWTYL